jgi:hypothetical protein
LPRQQLSWYSRNKRSLQILAPFCRKNCYRLHHCNGRKRGCAQGDSSARHQYRKDKYISTAATIALGTDVTRIPVYISQGFLTDQHFLYLPVLFGIVLTGSFIGRRIVKRMNQELFRKFVLIAIIFASIKFIIDDLLAQ